MAVKIVLGTANFGTNYGFLGRRHRQPVVNKVLATEIISAARDLGINEIDTAITYGPSQAWIGEISASCDFLVNTKIPWHGVSEESKYRYQIEQIIKDLRSRRLNLLQWHNWESSLDQSLSYNELQEKLNPRGEFAFGVTTYGPASVIEAISMQCFKSIQFEFNVLNQAALKAFLQFENKGLIRPYLRSILLQGLLTDLEHGLEINKMSIHSEVMKVKEIATEWGLSTQELAIRSVLSQIDECALVLGVDSVSQLVSMHEIIKKGPLSDELSCIVGNLDNSSDPNVDPRNW
jgi:aryl-alcohol dehydrogenase-like predicted oxidoreductase